MLTSTFRTIKSQIRFIHLQVKSLTNTHAIVNLDGKDIAYDWIFLRDSCQCSNCIDQSTRQKLHSTTDIPFDIKPKKEADVKIIDNQTLEILWPENNQQIHRSLYSSQWLQTYSTLNNIQRARYNNDPPKLWTRKDIEKVNLQIDIDEYLHSDQGFYKTLKHLNDYGLVFINNVHGEFAVEQLTQRIGDIRQTFYGRSWDVRSVENAINVAYTSQSLGLHMDLLYFEAPPGLQFLHVLKNTVQGGASFYADTFRAAEYIRQNDPQAFRILCSFPVTYHYRNINRHYHFTRSTIVLNRFLENQLIDHINYSPPFQAPFECDTSRKDFREFLRALKIFRDLIENQENQFELLLQEHQCVIFHNRRVLHARRQFDSTSGQRWLKGCYTDLDNFKDRWRILREKQPSTTN